MIDGKFEFCVVDPEGDYTGLEGATCLGNAQVPPHAGEMLTIVLRAGINAVIDMTGLYLPERRALFLPLLQARTELRARTGRPHWFVVDEAHQFLSGQNGKLDASVPGALGGTILITVNPLSLPVDILTAADAVFLFGAQEPEALRALAQTLRMELPDEKEQPGADEALFWSRRSGGRPKPIRMQEPRQPHRRHSGKYALGDVGEPHSFYFRGPAGAVNRRAKNLMEFLQLASEIDDAVWDHHLRAGDYSAWVRTIIKDTELADEIAGIEAERGLTANASRQRIAEAISRRYTIPAD
jgi:hypothetical protein